jgi:hypothetical protein
MSPRSDTRVTRIEEERPMKMYVAGEWVDKPQKIDVLNP